MNSSTNTTVITMENNATVMLMRLLLQRAVETMGKDADPETLERFLNTTDMDVLSDNYHEVETQQFCRFGDYYLYSA